MRWVATFLLALAALLLGAADMSRAPSVGVRPPDSFDPIQLLDLLDRRALDILRQSPETVTLRGLGAQLGMRDDALDGVALDTTGDGYALYESTLRAIEAVDLSRLPERDRWAVQAYATWLRDVVEGRDYQAYACPVSTYLTSVPQHIAWFMESVHPLATLENAEDYLSRLSQIPSRLTDLAGRLSTVERAGALAPRRIVLRAADEIGNLGSAPPDDSPFFRRFATALEAIPGLAADTRQSLREQAKQQVAGAVLPAYRELADVVRALAQTASDEIGVWRLANGYAYYRYLLRAHTTTDMTPEEIALLGTREVGRLQSEVRAAASRLGYDSSLPFPSLFAAIRDDAGVVSGDGTVAACRDLVHRAAERARGAFLDWPDSPLAVEPGGRIACFAEGTDDGTRPGVFFVPVDQVRPVYSLASLVCHETIPGHFLQMATARDASLPGFLGGVSFSGYTEGWATYAERLAWELGAYDDDPLGNLGRLQEELFRAARLVVDPGIHAFGWTYDEAIRYMIDATGLSEATVRDEVDRYIVAPGQATAYGVGLYTLLDLRDRARAALGAAFDLAEFHRVVLSCGSVPFSILEEVVDDYVAEDVRP